MTHTQNKITLETKSAGKIFVKRKPLARLTPHKNAPSKAKIAAAKARYLTSTDTLVAISKSLKMTPESLRRKIITWGWGARPSLQDRAAQQAVITASAPPLSDSAEPPASHRLDHTALATRLEHAIGREINKVEAALHAAGDTPSGALAAERKARVLAQLLRALTALGQIEKMRATSEAKDDTNATAISDTSAQGQENFVPHDIDELRAEIARRLARLRAAEPGA